MNIQKNLPICFMAFTVINFLGCSDLANCPEASTPVMELGTENLSLLKTSEYRYTIDSGKTYIQGIANIGFNVISTSENALPYFKSNNFTLIANGQPLPYYPFNNASGGIHGNCPIWNYPLVVGLSITTIDTLISLSLLKDKAPINSWLIDYYFDTSKTPAIGLSISNDSSLIIKVATRDTSGKYEFRFMDTKWNSVHLKSGSVEIADSIVINFQDVPFLNGDKDTSKIAYLDYYVSVHYTSLLNQVPANSNSARVVDYDKFQELPYPIIALLQKYRWEHKVKI